MYLKTELGIFQWFYQIYAANHVAVCVSRRTWKEESACIRAAKKMARRLGIEYREVK